MRDIVMWIRESRLRKFKCETTICGIIEYEIKKPRPQNAEYQKPILQNVGLKYAEPQNVRPHNAGNKNFQFTSFLS